LGSPVTENVILFSAKIISPEYLFMVGENNIEVTVSAVFVAAESKNKVPEGFVLCCIACNKTLDPS
jgi:hypothetical protein